MKYLALLFLLAINNSFAQADIEDKMINLEKLKTELQSTVGSIPYRSKEQLIIKNYFDAIMLLAEEINASPKLIRRFNRYLEKQNMMKFCSSVILKKSDWNSIKSSCTRNSFFLCSESVNEFSLSKNSLFNTLSVESLKLSKQTPECQ